MTFCRNPYEVESSSMAVNGNQVTWTVTSNAACDVHFEVNETCYPSWPGNKDCQVDTVVYDAHLLPHVAWTVTASLPNCYQVDGVFDNHDGFYRLINTVVGGELPCVPESTTTTTEVPSTTTTTERATTTTTAANPTTTQAPGSTTTVQAQTSSTTFVAKAPELPNTGAMAGDLSAVAFAGLALGIAMVRLGKRLRPSQ